MSTLERAIALAAAAHSGQIDKTGAPYVAHSLRVMARVSGEERMIAAVLHDVLEDTPVTAKWLRELGFSTDVVDAIEALTKRRDEAPLDRYFDFVVRASRHPLARDVKRADLLDNMDAVRTRKPKASNVARLDRYRRALKLVEAIGRASGDYRESAPTILPLTNVVTVADVARECPWESPIYACDFALDGAEDDGSAGGLRSGRILNVDHHADIERMRGSVTSSHLAYEHLKTRGAIEAESWVVINHTDCDSILSSAMLMGLIEPKAKFVTASVCADHTGAENPIADLLQALDESRIGARTDEQYLESLRNLRLLLKGKPLEAAATVSVALRRSRREKAERLVEEGTFHINGGVAAAVLDEDIDSAFFAPLLPGAAVILMARRHPKHSEQYVVKVRLGLGAPAGLTLHALGVKDWDANFGGRWNAGGNKRPPSESEPGGTELPPEEYAGHLRARLARALAQSPPDQPTKSSSGGQHTAKPEGPVR